jgi:hypothetical protein
MRLIYIGVDRRIGGCDRLINVMNENDEMKLKCILSAIEVCGSYCYNNLF